MASPHTNITVHTEATSLMVNQFLRVFRAWTQDPPAVTPRDCYNTVNIHISRALLR